MPRTAVLFQVHAINQEIVRRLRLLEAGMAPDMDCFLALDATASRVRMRVSRELAREHRLFFFSRALLERLPSPRAQGQWLGRSIRPGLCDLVPQLFRRVHPEYDFVYIVEYDVLYSGDWAAFFSHFRRSEADLLATNVASRSELPDCVHFQGLATDRSPTPEESLRAFMPICRYSAAALAALEERYHRGWRGHFEVLVPTAVRDAGLRLEDFGGDGPFVAPGNRDRFYTSNRLSDHLRPGSFVLNPAPTERPGPDRPLLLHPCKLELQLDAPTLWTLLRSGPYSIRRHTLGYPQLGEAT